MGAIWTSLHCAGMCGPIMLGLSQNAPPTVSGRARFVASYQVGRAFIYSIFGAIAGFVGGELGLSPVMLGVLMIVLAVAIGLHALGWLPKERLAEWTKPILKRGFRPDTLAKPLLLGVVMAFLPCSLVFWAIGLAAASGGAMNGTVTMLLLIVTTTPILMTVALLGHRVGRVRYGEWIVRAVQLLSAIWIALVGAASIGWIEHQNVHFRIGENAFGIMFF